MRNWDYTLPLDWDRELFIHDSDDSWPIDHVDYNGADWEPYDFAVSDHLANMLHAKVIAANMRLMISAARCYNANLEYFIVRNRIRNARI